MYIESQPTTIHWQHAAKTMEDLKPQLHRPPAVLNYSSSLLHGMEMIAPSFQEFVKRASPISFEKALPAAPMVATSPVLQPSNLHPRRTSSVYSRTLSQWAPTPESSRTRDSATRPLLLKNTVYSASTPELAANRTQEHHFANIHLEPRAYQPLLRSPSPSPSPSLVETLSSRSSVTPLDGTRKAYLAGRRPSILLPIVQTPALHLKHRVETDSLGKAIATSEYDSTCLELPAKMNLVSAGRANTIAFRKSRSTGDLGIGSATNAISYLPQSSSYLETDHHLRQRRDEWECRLQRTEQPASWTHSPVFEYEQRDSKLSDAYFESGPMVEAEGASSYSNPFSVTSDEPRLPRTLEDQDYENRGRHFSSLLTVAQESRASSHKESQFGNQASNIAVISEADRLAKGYHDLFDRFTLSRCTIRGGEGPSTLLSRTTREASSSAAFS